MNQDDRPVSWPASTTFTYHSMGHRSWKFHGGTANNVIEDKVYTGSKRHAPTRKLSMQEGSHRKLTRTLSVGSVCSSSESECSSQSSMGSPDAEDLAKEFLTGPNSPERPVSRNEPLSQTCELLIETPGDNSHQTFKAKILPTPNFSLSGLVKMLSNVGSVTGNDIEIIQNNKALALKLQQRRPRKVLADQGIIPPLKSPATHFHQVQKLERARTGDILNRKILGRPERDTLVAKHILEDTSAYPSIHAQQKELKKAKLVDDLNEKIALRPGVFDLVKKNIIQTENGLQEAIQDGQVQYSTTDDLDGDSSDAFSPDPNYQQGESSGSMLHHPKSLDSSPPITNLQQQSNQFYTSPPSSTPDSALWSPNGILQHTSSGPVTSQSNKITTSSSHMSSHPYLYRQSSGTKGTKTTQSSKRNIRKTKDKPKFKRYKYHQYIPPDQGKQSATSSIDNKDIPSMNAHYSRVLEQQQLYLQLQIMNMNQHYPAIRPSPKATGDKQLQDINKSYLQQNNVSAPPPPPPPPNPQPRSNTGDKHKRVFTEQQLEDMKVAELKEELKARSLKVTGTKEVLVERLKPYAIHTMQANQQHISRDIKSLINATIESTMRTNAEMAANSGSQASSAPVHPTNTSQPPIFNAQNMNSISSNQSNNHSFTMTSNNSRPNSVPMDTHMDSNNSSQPSDANYQFPSASETGLHVAPPRPVLTTHQTDQNNRDRKWGKKSVQSGDGNPHVVKNQLLQEIEDLRRMVDLHKTQLRQIQGGPPQQMPDNTAMSSGSNQSSFPMQQQVDNSSQIMEENSTNHQNIAQMLQQHLQNKIQRGPMYNTEQVTMVKQERSPPMMHHENQYNFANSPPNISLVPLKAPPPSNSNPSPNPPMQHDSYQNMLQQNDMKHPPKYDQAIQFRNMQESKMKGGFQEAGTPGGQEASNYVDDLLALLQDKGEIPSENHIDKDINSNSVDMKNNYNMQNTQPHDNQSQQKLQMRKSFPQLDHYDGNMFMQDMNQQQQQQTLLRRHSEDLLAQPCQQNQTGHNQSQFTRQLLVNSAGDILMDNSSLVSPPSNVSHRGHPPGCIPPEAVTMPQFDQQRLYGNSNYGMFGDSNMMQHAHSGLELRGSNPNLLEDPYTSQPFSPMDTNSCDGSRGVPRTDDRMRDPQLSSSSIHDSEPALDKAGVAINNLPNNTASCVRRYRQPLAGDSPHHLNNLTKSTSQELLSTLQHTPVDQSMQVEELKWLDLTCGSPLAGPALPLNHGNTYHSSESILGSEGNGDGTMPLSSSLQSFGSPSPFINNHTLGSNEFDLIDEMNLNPMNPSSMSPLDTWDKMLSS